MYRDDPVSTWFYLPINAIHMYSGLKADLFPVRERDELRQSASCYGAFGL